MFIYLLLYLFIFTALKRFDLHLILICSVLCVLFCFVSSLEIEQYIVNLSGLNYSYRYISGKYRTDLELKLVKKTLQSVAKIQHVLNLFKNLPPYVSMKIDIIAWPASNSFKIIAPSVNTVKSRYLDL